MQGFFRQNAVEQNTPCRCADEQTTFSPAESRTGLHGRPPDLLRRLVRPALTAERLGLFGDLSEGVSVKARRRGASDGESLWVRGGFPGVAGGRLECASALLGASGDGPGRGSLLAADHALHSFQLSQCLPPGSWTYRSAGRDRAADGRGGILDGSARQQPRVSRPRALESGTGRRELPCRRDWRFLRGGLASSRCGQAAGGSGAPCGSPPTALEPFRAGFRPARHWYKSTNSAFTTHSPGACSPGWWCWFSFPTICSTTSPSG